MNDLFYKKLEAYKLAKEFTMYVYSLLKKFPSYEQYALCDQLRRAAISIPSNIAEGTSKISPKEQFHFLEISYGSLMELMCQTEIAYDLGYISTNDYKLIEDAIGCIYKMLSSMQAVLKSRLQGNHL